MTQRIWKIRDLIQALEKVKDAVIEFFNSRKTMDASQQCIWISDVKEMYYT